MTADAGSELDFTDTATLRIPDADKLAGYLDDMNGSGVDPTLVGLDARRMPFLIHLVGPDPLPVVLFGSPWDGEVDYGKGRYCEDCNASNLMDIDDLRFPIVVLVSEKTSSCDNPAECDDPECYGFGITRV